MKVESFPKRIAKIKFKLKKTKGGGLSVGPRAPSLVGKFIGVVQKVYRT